MNSINLTDTISIRENLEAGDLGYLAYLHAKIYKEECHYDLEFEGYVCKTFYDFTLRHSKERDRFFIAEKEGVIIGNVAILGYSDTEAQLRWFLIEPKYRGIGLGNKLFKRAMQFCEEMDYKKIWLLTTSDQEQASSMYEKAGFKVTEETSQEIWGRVLIEKRYELNR